MTGLREGCEAVRTAGAPARPAEAALRERTDRLAALSRQLVDDEERRRRRLAHELHDEVAQGLTALKIAIRLLAERPGDPAGLERALGIADRLIDQVRALALDLRPPVLDELGLDAALRWYAAQPASLEGPPVEWALDLGEARATPAVETAGFRVAQEAITNALRHARASRVRVVARRRGRGLELVVEDDGTGFDVAAAWHGAARGGAPGLLRMDERTTLVDGRLSIESTRGKGTTVRAWFPLDGTRRPD